MLVVDWSISVGCRTGTPASAGWVPLGKCNDLYRYISRCTVGDWSMYVRRDALAKEVTTLASIQASIYCFKLQEVLSKELQGPILHNGH